ncbi:aldo/keto reductase [Evansella tamaricis]|uniref:Aldo/keto reductase n=1 Tax=Evansella tamaricis TaxID=2069301 RepID=A0ABS6JM41_9BACI|nr:aldo/keto reductase [Evansella tamaricis]MBU9714752.1 aldo/keto reductase [Evansella tamaricis]
MKKNQLGNSDLFVSEIGFGCMSLTKDPSETEKILHQAIDGGINFFDTADLYQQGMNEEAIGKALHKHRNSIILASKGGNEWGEGIDGWRWNPSKKYIKRALKASLKRLNTDYLDLYQLHGGTMEDPIEETIEAFEELVQEGTVRYYGISSIRPNVIKTFLEKSSIVSIMMQYSLFDRRPEEWLSLIKEHNVSVIARGPVAKGLLTDGFERKLSPDGYLTYSKQELEDTIGKLNLLAKRENLSLQQLALRYVIDHPTVATAIPGASTMDQLMDNLTAASLPPLKSEITEKLRTDTKTTYYEQHR